MRILFATAVVTGSMKSCANQVETCDDIMSQAEAPAWCVQNTGDESISISGFNRPPEKYFADVEAGRFDPYRGAMLAPKVGMLTQDLFPNDVAWLCLDQLDLATGVVEIHGRRSFTQENYYLLDPLAPRMLVCFH